MTHPEYQYLNLLSNVMSNGISRDDRTGTGTRSVFGRQIRFDLTQGFPLLTTKKVFVRGIIEELLWFLRGSTNARELEDLNVNIWKGWGDPETRELGPVYGKQWRSWETPKVVERRQEKSDIVLAREIQVKKTDQIAELVERLKSDPNSRRHMVVAWNPGEIEQMALPPCHCLFQFYVRPLKPEQRPNAVVSVSYDNEAEEHDRIDRRAFDLGEPIPARFALDCQLYQRSADIFLGVPFNIASYALLTMMLAQQCGYAPGEFVHTFGDLHLYDNHVEQAHEQLSREPRPLPRMEIKRAADIFSYTIEDFDLVGYDPHPTIKAPVAI